jgi:hypothetical protein
MGLALSHAPQTAWIEKVENPIESFVSVFLVTTEAFSLVLPIAVILVIESQGPLPRVPVSSGNKEITIYAGNNPFTWLRHWGVPG